MKKIMAAALFCILVFAIGVFAQNPAQPNSAPMGTSQSPQTTQPSQTVPPAPATPSGKPGLSAQQPSQAQMSNIDEQVKILSDQLNLTPDQQSKTKNILMDQHQQAMTLVQDSSMPREQKMEKIHSLRETTIAKVRQLLNDDQKSKFDQMVAQQNERLRQGQEGAPSSSTPPSGNPPSSTMPGSNPPSTSSPSTTPPGSTPPPSPVKPPQ